MAHCLYMVFTKRNSVRRHIGTAAMVNLMEVKVRLSGFRVLYSSTKPCQLNNNPF